MHKILLPVDFTEGTGQACQYALRLAAAFGQVQLLLLHCYQDYLTDAEELPVTEAGSSAEVTAQVLRRNESEAEAQLEELYETLVREASSLPGQVLVERSFISGQPEDKIVEEAQRFKPDLVLMATRGKVSLSRSLFGTVATKVAQELPMPVLTVPEGAALHKPGNVLYATDFDDTDTAAIGKLQQLLKPFSPIIQCLHISEGSRQHDKARLTQLKEALEERVPAQNIHFTLLEGDDVANALQQFVQRHRIDLLALTTRKRGFFGSLLHPSLANKLVLEAAVPLLVFHSLEKA